MAAVDVRISHDDDAVIAEFIGLVFFNTNASTKNSN